MVGEQMCKWTEPKGAVWCSQHLHFWSGRLRCPRQARWHVRWAYLLKLPAASHLLSLMNLSSLAYVYQDSTHCSAWWFTQCLLFLCICCIQLYHQPYLPLFLQNRLSLSTQIFYLFSYTSKEGTHVEKAQVNWNKYTRQDLHLQNLYG